MPTNTPDAVKEQVVAEQRCDAVVYHRDTYRYTGRGKNGFEMHYNREQCKRRATGGDLCTQHQKTPSILRYSRLFK